MCRPSSGRVRATIGTQPDFQAFLGSFWVMFKMRSGHGRDEALLSGNFGQFLGTVYRPCPGRLLARSYSRRIRAMAGTEPDFQVISSNFWAW
ncbi:Hypothetical predicted protein [Olea europaea subsp. europaea]|uniref:Uncharacterized protein n=1 Tax=Olea europaea subsp. europaea TaxID=158383 RepID=A0A8S0V0J0_OLEEU|nr:Hypothetical predicted protein [Olea europaea subsp. europaea]